MYNGIGLQTARGSGTNGYVQKNMAFMRTRKEKVEYNSEEDLARLERTLHKAPNKELMEHNWKRKIELQCLELQEKMEEEKWVRAWLNLTNHAPLIFFPNLNNNF